jgi:ABC-type spermidine/putrescine transport system permease subunit II
MIEKIKLKVENLREILKFLLLLIFSIISGIVTLSFWVLIKKVESFFAIFIGIGIIVLFFLVKVTLTLWSYMNKLIEEISDDC